MKSKKEGIILLVAVIIGIFYSNILSAQVVADITGRNWKQTNVYSEVAGSPFLSEEWARGTVKFSNNTLSNDVDLKYDQIDDVLLFKNDKQETLEITDPITEFKINYTKDGKTEQKLFRSGFAPSNNNTEKSYYEVLFDENVKFLKRTVKTIIEESEYNSSVKTRKIIEKPYYFIVKGGNMLVLVNKNEKGILSAIDDKTAELSSFIKTNKLNLKNDEDIVKVLAYYSALTKKA